MKLKYLFNNLNKLVYNYSLIIDILLKEYNKYYNGKNKIELDNNLKKMNNMCNLIRYINETYFIDRDNVDNFFKLFEKLNMDNYNLTNIDNFFYHIDMNIYKFCIIFYYYLKDIIKCIKKLCNDVQIVKTEIKEINDNKTILSLSSSVSLSSSNDYIKNIINFSAIKKHSNSFNKEYSINELISYLKDKKTLEKINKELEKNGIDKIEEEFLNKEYKFEIFLREQTEDKLKKIKYLIITKNEIIEEIISYFMKYKKRIEDIKNELYMYDINIKEILDENIKEFLETQTEDKLKIIKLIIITKYDLINEIIIIFLLNLVKIDKKKILKIREEILILDEYLNEETTYDTFFKSQDKIRDLLDKQTIDKIVKIKEIIIYNFSYKNLSSGIKKEEVINEIINSLFEIQINKIFNNIKYIITSNYNKKSNSKEDNDIILEIIKKVFITQPNDRIKTIENIILTYYNKIENNNSNEENINIIIEEIVKKRNNKAIINIRKKLNTKAIFKLEKYLHENEYLNLLTLVDEIRDILRQEENKKLIQINKIILSEKKKFNTNKNEEYNELEYINNFLNSLKFIYIYNINKIYYVVYKKNLINYYLNKSNLINKKLILNKIIYKSNTNSGDDIEYNNTKFKIKIDLYNKEIYKLITIDDVKTLVKIYELYNKIVSINLTDIKIKENVKEILTMFIIEYDDIIKQRFKEINEYYKFDYEITNIENFHLYKNYINEIIKLYEYLLSVKDNFNLIYSIIEKIKKKIELYKKIDNTLMEILFEKLNKINNDKMIDKRFITYKDLYIYLDTLL